MDKRLIQRIQAGYKWLYEFEERESEQMVQYYLGKKKKS